MPPKNNSARPLKTTTAMSHVNNAANMLVADPSFGIMIFIPLPKIGWLKSISRSRSVVMEIFAIAPSTSPFMTLLNMSEKEPCGAKVTSRLMSAPMARIKSTLKPRGSGISVKAKGGRCTVAIVSGSAFCANAGKSVDIRSKADKKRDLS